MFRISLDLSLGDNLVITQWYFSYQLMVFFDLQCIGIELSTLNNFLAKISMDLGVKDPVKISYGALE